MFDTLVAQEVISPDVAAKAATVPLHTASSVVARLVVAGEDAKAMLRAVAELAAIPVATRAQIATSAPVQLSQTVARALRVVTACPVQQAPDGTLHVLIAEPDARPEVERLLPGCVVYLAHEDQVRDLLLDLYPTGSSVEGGPPVGAIDVDLEASSRVPISPNPAGAAAPSAPEARPADPLAPRASGPFKTRSFSRDDETLRIERAPRAEAEDRASVAVATLPAAARPVGHALTGDAERAVSRAFWRGAFAGALVMGALAAVAIGLLLMR
jgi:hypothetical protein